MARKKRVHASPMRPEIQGALWVAGLYGRLSVLDNGKVDGEPIESQIAIIEQYVAGHPELKIVVVVNLIDKIHIYPDKKITVTLLCKDQLTDVIAFLREQVQTQHAAEKEAG